MRGTVPTALRFLACYRAASLLMATDVRGVCCCGPIPIPFRFWPFDVRDLPRGSPPTAKRTTGPRPDATSGAL